MLEVEILIFVKLNSQEKNFYTSYSFHPYLTESLEDTVKQASRNQMEQTRFLRD
jgi:hypothetical protein